jgi:1-deoxy-D-xylulose-5-phosphate reductoisomerase
VLNTANEIAVQGFLSRQIKFTDIIPFIKNVLDKEHGEKPTSVDEVLLMDRAIRRSATLLLEQEVKSN